MNCSRFQDQIDDHVDGLLSAPEGELVRAHLDGCRDCREEAEAARLASTSLSAWGDEFGELEPPAHCFDDILARIDSLPPAAFDRSSPDLLRSSPELSVPAPTTRTPRFALLRGGRAPATWLAGSAAAIAATLVIALQLASTASPVSPDRAPRRAVQTPVMANTNATPASAGTVAASLFGSGDRLAGAHTTGPVPAALTTNASMALSGDLPGAAGGARSANTLDANTLDALDWIEDQGLKRRRVIRPQTAFPANLPGNLVPASFDSGTTYPR